MIDIRLPNITGTTDAAQLAQIRSYLYQFAEQMKWALNTLETGQNNDSIVLPSSSTSAPAVASEVKAQDTFNEIKSLIIKSADIVEAYYEEIDKMISLDGKYVAQSEFGTYAEETNHSISATTDGIIQNFNKIATIESDVQDINDFITKNNSYIKSGLVGTTLDDRGLATDDAPGIEVGGYQVLDDGVSVETHERYARFTAYGLELFGSDKTYPVAYIKQTKLYITNAEITGTLKVGGYEISTSNGLSFKWVGRS